MALSLEKLMAEAYSPFAKQEYLIVPLLIILLMKDA